MKTAIETERKFLIRMPEDSALRVLPGCRVSVITQTYLVNRDGKVERVRKREFGDRIQYTHTCKRRLSSLSATEEEAEITLQEYEELLKRRDNSKNVIHKIRYAIPFGGHTAEIDVYPFWKKQAVLEIELNGEADNASLPEWLTLIREVSGNHAYSNNSLAEKIPSEDEA